MLNLKAQKHSFVVSLVCSILLIQFAALTPFSHASKTLINPGKPSLDVQVDAGSIHFRGELAEFYVLVSQSGSRVDAYVSANLYFNGTLYANLTSFVQKVDTGLFRIPFTIPTDAKAGAYTLGVDAQYPSATKSFGGTGLKSFEISQTLSNWNA